MILTNQSLKVILYQLDTSDRMTKWALKFSEFYIQYHLRPSMKAQVLIDFIIEYTIFVNNSEDEPNDKLKQVETLEAD